MHRRKANSEEIDRAAGKLLSGLKGRFQGVLTKDKLPARWLNSDNLSPMTSLEAPLQLPKKRFPFPIISLLFRQESHFRFTSSKIISHEQVILVAVWKGDFGDLASGEVNNEFGREIRLGKKSY